MASHANFGINADWNDEEITLEITTCLINAAVDDPYLVGVLEPRVASLTELPSVSMWLLNIDKSQRFSLPMDEVLVVHISSTVSVPQHGIGVLDENTITIVGIIIKNNVYHIWSDRLTELGVHPLSACISLLGQR